MIENNDLISIGDASKLLGVSIDTLRRWDKSGKLRSIKSAGGHRLYPKQQLELFKSDLYNVAKNWVTQKSGIQEQLYCPNSAVFQSRLIKMQDSLSLLEDMRNTFPLVVAIAGEIGNNSFDHNLGNWPDAPGVFFGYDSSKKIIVLADRGRGVLTTLKRVRPDLHTHEDALRVAFTEVVSGRAPETRGNGLKFVRQVISSNTMSLSFETGDALLELKNNDLILSKATEDFRGCLAMIKF